MIKFGILAIVPALVLSWLVEKLVKFRGASATGGALAIVGIGLLGAFVARRSSPMPYRWGTGIRQPSQCSW